MLATTNKTNIRLQKALWCIIAVFVCSAQSYIIAADEKEVLVNETVRSFIEESNTSNPEESVNKNAITVDTKTLIQTFCASVLETDLNKHNFFQQNTVAQTAYFDATQSVFLYILCKPGGFEEEFPLIHDTQLLKKDTREDYGLPCNGSGQLDSCRLYRNIDKIIVQILNDMSNIKIASSYGVSNFASGSKLTDQANQFGSYYFGDNLVLCDPQSDKDDTCTYPQTHSHLTAFLRRADSIAKKDTTFDLKNIRKSESDICLKWLDENNYENFNPIICGLIGQQKEKGASIEPASLHDFTNLVYNELWRYKLFTTHYAHMLRVNLQLQPYSLTSNPGRYNDQVTQQATILTQTNHVIEATAETMIQHIAHIQFKFPLHIGLVMYHERLVELRQSLARAYTPLHQLYYKLRNVQQAK